MIRTRTKVLIDAYAGRALVLLLNVCARILGRMLAPDHTFRQPPATIVVCKYLGMGSIIQSTPLLQTLRRNFPAARLLFLTAAGNRPLVASIEGVSGVLTVDDDSLLRLAVSTLRVLYACWTERVDLYIDLDTYSYFSAAVATMSCARNRLGYYRAEQNIRMGVYTHMMFFNPRAPIAQSYLQMARLAGCREIIDDLYRFPVGAAARERCARTLHALAGVAPQRYVVINPNASDLRIERRWPAERFAQLAQGLAERFPECVVVLIGSASEAAYVASVRNRCAPETRRVVSTAGAFTLEELFALIDGSTLMVTNDTGPMHIASALGRPTISLFGPASPWQYGDNPHVTGVYKNLYCSPCVHEFLAPPCNGDNQCMTQISVDEVMALCTQMLGGAPAPRTAASGDAIQFSTDEGRRALGVVERAG